MGTSWPRKVYRQSVYVEGKLTLDDRVAKSSYFSCGIDSLVVSGFLGVSGRAVPESGRLRQGAAGRQRVIVAYAPGHPSAPQTWRDRRESRHLRRSESV